MWPSVLLVFQTVQEESTQILRGIAQYCRMHQRWDAFLDDEAKAVHNQSWIKDNNWKGVISRHTTPALVRHCQKNGIPLVDLSDSPPFPAVAKIRPDNIAIGHLGAEHLLDRGLRHFGFCGYNNTFWSRERRTGFEEAVKLAGFDCAIREVHYPGRLSPSWDARQKQKLAVWLKALPNPIGIMANCDLLAQELTAAALVAGKAIPEDVAIIGANNETVRCDLTNPPLSSVAPNAFQSGYQAAEHLDSLMRGLSTAPIDIRIEPMGVVTRQSSDILAVPDRTVAAALRHIRQHACSGLTVSEVVKTVASTRSNLEKKFRKYLGRSPQAEIRRIQINQIRRLLIESNHPLKKIAELTGFEHTEYMSVVFRRLTGETPGVFRNRSRTTN